MPTVRLLVLTLLLSCLAHAQGAVTSASRIDNLFTGQLLAWDFGLNGGLEPPFDESKPHHLGGGLAYFSFDSNGGIHVSDWGVGMCSSPAVKPGCSFVGAEISMELGATYDNCTLLEGSYLGTFVWREPDNQDGTPGPVHRYENVTALYSQPVCTYPNDQFVGPGGLTIQLQ